MSTQVYYRKWRPQRFSDLVGQEPIARTLRQAVAHNRVAHAYLFCGPRGTGKTSTARILAKGVNCLSPQDGEPCNQCRLCTAVNEGHALDLIEVDAASNRGIDEIRSIREKVHYSPSEGKYKVYVLDEAHMLTDAAADALLKTLEEPPPHIIFIMATTEPDKLASTIVSRCQRYDFRRIEPSMMSRMLATICDAEGIEAEPSALHVLARNADGSMRDAEGLLEQAVTSFGSPLTLAQVQLLLGLTADDRVRLLIRQILAGATPEALITLNSVASEGLNLHQLHRQLVSEVRDLLLTKSGAQSMVTQPQEVLQAQAQLVQDVSVDKLLLVLRLLGRVTFRNDASPSLALELAIIEAAQDHTPTKQIVPPAYTAASTEKAVTASRPAAGRAKSAPPPSAREAPAPPATQPVAPAQARTEMSPTAELPTATDEDGMVPPERLQRHWDAIIKALSRYKGRRFYLGSLLRDCRQYWLEDDTLYLAFSHESHMDRMKEEMDQPEGRRRFIEVITKATGILEPLKIAFMPPNGSQRNDRARSPMVQAALSMGGRIIEESEGHDE